MAVVVFLRGVNVGGRKAFRPSALARDLQALRVTNLGAAGTYVVREEVGPEDLRREILRRLPFEAEVMICPGEEIADLVDSNPLGGKSLPKDARRFVSILAGAPRHVPRLPFERPRGRDWQVKLVRVAGRYALSLWRRRGSRFLYPNVVVEREFGVAATTRSWNTMRKLRDRLREEG